MPRTAGKMKNWVLENIKLETSLEVKMTKLKLSYFGDIMRKQGSLEKIILGEIECSRERGRLHMKWIDLVKRPKACVARS